MEAQNMRMGNSVLGALEGIWEQTRSIDSRIRVTTCKTGDRRLLDKVFELKPIKRGGKIPFRQPKKSLEFQSNSTNKCLLKLRTTTLQHPLPPIPISQGN